MSPDDERADCPQRDRQPRRGVKMIDCDVHHALRSPKDLYPYLSARWREHLETLWHPPTDAVHRFLAVSQGGAGVVAHGFLAARMAGHRGRI